MKKFFITLGLVILLPSFLMFGESNESFTDRVTLEFYDTQLEGEHLSIEDTEVLIKKVLKQGSFGTVLLDKVPGVRAQLNGYLLSSLGEYFDDKVTVDGIILLGIFGMFREGVFLLDNVSFSMPPREGVSPAEVSEMSVFFQVAPPEDMDYVSMYGNLGLDYCIRDQVTDDTHVPFCAGIFDASAYCSLDIISGDIYVTIQSSSTDLITFETPKGHAKVVFTTEYTGSTPLGESLGVSTISVAYDVLDQQGRVAYSGSYVGPQRLGFNCFGLFDTSPSPQLPLKSFRKSKEF